MTREIGALIIDVQDYVLTAEERELLAHPAVGGIILFTRNYQSRIQLIELCRQIRATRAQPLLIMVDQEGGRVQRFIPEFTRLPPLAHFGELYEQNTQAACSAAEKGGYLMASELRAVGIDISLAPVLDLQKGVNSMIGDRALHAQAAVVSTLATAFMRGMQRAGMAATGKHFPGHGSVGLDSHQALPCDERPLEIMMQDDLLPFIHLIKQGLPAVMAAHIVFPEVDPNPVGFSAVWLQDILRKRLGFTGTILSDDLNMQGANISTNYADRVVAARSAGCDFALLCNNRAGVLQVLNNLPHQAHQVSPEKWRNLYHAA